MVCGERKLNNVRYVEQDGWMNATSICYRCCTIAIEVEYAVRPSWDNNQNAGKKEVWADDGGKEGPGVKLRMCES